MKNVGWRKGFIGSWDKAQPPGLSGPAWQDWAGKVFPTHAVPEGHWVALVVKTCTFLGSSPTDSTTQPLTISATQRWNSMLPTCPSGEHVSGRVWCPGLFLRGRVSWDLRSDSVPSLTLGQSSRPWCQKGLYGTRLADGASCAQTTGVY